MSVKIEDEQYFKTQITEIRKYLKQHRGENQNQCIMDWIKDNAEVFRKIWETEH